MSAFSIRAFKNVLHYGLPVYGIFRDGRLIGELTYVHRPKNAGGNAWQATLHRRLGKMVVPNSYYAKDKKEALAMLKADERALADAAEDRQDMCLRKPLTYRNGVLINSLAETGEQVRFEFHKGRMTAK